MRIELFLAERECASKISVWNLQDHCSTGFFQLYDYEWPLDGPQDLSYAWFISWPLSTFPRWPL